MTGAWLREQRKSKGWTQAAFANALGVSKGALGFWEWQKDQPIPPSRQPAVLHALHELKAPPPVRRQRAVSAMSDLRERRFAAGLTQAEFADRAGFDQAQVSSWELGKVPISEASAARAEEVLSTATAERVTAEWVRRQRERAGLTQGELGQALGVKKGVVQGWESGRRIPAGSWQGIRSVLDRAPAAERPEPMRNLRERREAKRWSQSDLARRLGVSGSLVSLWEHGALIAPAMRRRIERELAEGAVAADAVAERQAAIATERRTAIAALVSAEPGLSGRQIMLRTGGDWYDVRAAIAALEDVGEYPTSALLPTRTFEGSRGRARAFIQAGASLPVSPKAETPGTRAHGVDHVHRGDVA